MPEGKQRLCHAIYLSVYAVSYKSLVSAEPRALNAYMSDEPSLNKAYDLKTPDDSVRLYADWAETYEIDFVASHGYELHQHVAEAFHAANGGGPVLDIGAGTGLCGQSLKDLGVSEIDATDISEQMLQQASQKGVYRALITGDILDRLPIEDERYCGAVSAGTFTHGHVGPEALTEVLRILAPGGLAVLSINAEHFTAYGFDDAFEHLRSSMQSLHFEDVSIYAADATGANAKDLAKLAIFTKA